MKPIKRIIQYEAERVVGFGDEIRSVPGCEELLSCIQCGTCSGVCPLSTYMDYSPRQIIGMVRSGFKDKVLRSHTIWLCASCYACTVECPRKIRITDIMYELKQRALQERLYPRRFSIPILAQEFNKMAQTQGRVTENVLAAIMFLKSSWWSIFGMWRLGLGLIWRGRFPFLLESIKRKDELDRMLKTVDKITIDMLHDEPGKAVKAQREGVR
jgi:heterodisulfide reductase subunit C